jgi:hypothetical protein
MSYPELCDKISCTAVLPDGSEQEFILGDYLAWCELMGKQIPNEAVEKLIAWLNVDDNNFYRINDWLSRARSSEEIPLTMPQSCVCDLLESEKGGRCNEGRRAFCTAPYLNKKSPFGEFLIYAIASILICAYFCRWPILRSRLLLAL